MSTDWDKNEIIAQGRQAYANGTSFDANPYRFTPLTRGGLFKAAFWENGWKCSEADDIHAIADAE